MIFKIATPDYDAGGDQWRFSIEMHRVSYGVYQTDVIDVSYKTLMFIVRIEDDSKTATIWGCDSAEPYEYLDSKYVHRLIKLSPEDSSIGKPFCVASGKVVIEFNSNEEELQIKRME